MHRQQGSYPLGAKAGVESVTLTLQQRPSHTHLVVASNMAGTVDTPSDALWASPVPDGNPPPATPKVYSSSTDSTMSPQAVQLTGGSQPHDNMQPFLVVSYIISLFGIFPSQN